MKLWLAGIVKRLPFFGAKSSAETEIEIQVNVRPYYSMYIQCKKIEHVTSY